MKKVSEAILFQGNWLSIKESTFITDSGKSIKWESIGRKKNPLAFAILAKLIPSNKYLLIKQFRHTINNYFIGLPAGITPKTPISECELDECILKELLEETGYKGKIIKKSPVLKVNPGVMDDNFLIASIEVNESDPSNKNVKQCLDSSEDIQVLIVQESEIENYLLSEKMGGTDISAGLWFLFCV